MARTALVRTALAVLTAVALAACDGPAEHNAADTAFARRMIPHHAQAVDMAALVDGRTTNTEVVDLAQRIRTSHEPEIATMTDWLRAWGEPAAAQRSDEDMTELKAAEDTDFDRRWLAMMIIHHRSAVEEAETALAQGTHPRAKALARRIVDAREAEIGEMQALLPQG
ncbi:DUF305 domain-containing protein [Saccharothrix obliqua]|uniref:DUF305 domain-containing protein n=1 Tax=Saccharothrix obliqua TaxID=2861747 RepID=UPI001C5E9E44|nr:DUF305 domain-containing protein [Saccharothrix obliqua]MBW4720739.1 DUF305 domain-containing protein [Saccharothrix obliqua]